jgi:hypothetical protein
MELLGGDEDNTLNRRVCVAWSKNQSADQDGDGDLEQKTTIRTVRSMSKIL